MHLEQVSEKHIKDLYLLAYNNINHLKPWFPWISSMDSEDFFIRFVKMTKERVSEGIEKSFVIYVDEVLVGRIGLYKIDAYNSSSEIGYWIGKEYEGKGIIKLACKEMIRIAFEELNLHRLEIRCAQQNLRSQYIPQTLGFHFEGILYDAEKVNNQFHNIKLYSLINRR